jgi:hypothetical protein
MLSSDNSRRINNQLHDKLNKLHAQTPSEEREEIRKDIAVLGDLLHIYKEEADSTQKSPAEDDIEMYRRRP